MCDDDFYDDGFGEDFDEFEMEDNSLNDNVELENSSPKDPLSFENFLFWGGYLGMNFDETRRRRKIKKEDIEPDDILDVDKKDEDY